jgi:periplasmic divalent cation tolerance protein
METENPYIIVQVSASDTEQAWTIAQAVVTQKLVACAQVFPIRSVYEWEGGVTQDDEYLILMKTRRDIYERLEALVVELHSYDVPEIMALPVVAGSAPYLKWIDEVVGT